MLAIGERGMLGSCGKRSTLGFSERAVLVQEQAGGIFAVRPQSQGEKFGRQFVMLLICRVRELGNRISDHVLREGPVDRLVLSRKPGIGATNEVVDPGKGDRIRERKAFDGTDCRVDQAHGAGDPGQDVRWAMSFTARRTSQ